ncbi:hypothetical protein Tco_0499551 [Tanacetum coccineum]
MGDENPIRTLGDYSKPSYDGYRNTIELPVGKNVVPLRSDTIRLVQNRCSFHGLRSEDPNQHLKDFLKLVDTLDLDGDNKERTCLHLFQFSLCDQASNWLERLPAGSITTWEDLTTDSLLNSFHREGPRTIDQSASGKLRDLNAEESWALLEDLALYDNGSWNDPRDFSKPAKAIALPQDVPMNKITTSCEICSGPHDTQYCMEDPEQASVEYVSSRTDEAREGLVSDFKASQDARLSKFEADFKQQQRRIKGMHVFIGNFTYIVDFMIIEDISSIVGPRLSQVVLGRPFVEISNMTHDPPEGVIRFIDRTDEVSHKMPHKIEQYDSLSDLEKEHTKSVYLRNEEDKRRGIEYVMSKILGFYKECLGLGPEYLRGMDDEGEVT